MLSYVVRRLLYSVVVLVAASFLVFTFVSVSGDPLAQLRITPNVSEQSKQNVIDRKHLDEPIPVRYWYWVKDAVMNQFGTTLLGDRPILPDLWRVMKNTLQLVLVAELLAVLIAVGIGVYSALRQYSVFDYAATTVSFLGLATPLFWLALMLQVLVVQIYEQTGHRIFPIASLNSVDAGSGIHFVLDRAHHLVLPVVVLMVASVASYSRYMRAAMLEVINSDYVRTARAKGLPERRVTMKHAFRNALLPLVTLVALNFGTLLGGVIVTETVFSLDGMGLYFYNALLANDPYPVMAWLMVTATMIIVFNLIADIAYGYLDPRVRYD
ncbi:MAG: ABC transporter permease [Actinobacteria bacterium]|nr:ABC transporter permease [Actinomycetota bacterium]